MAGDTVWTARRTMWITPAGETTNYPKGVSVQNVPDMPSSGRRLADVLSIANDQTARLLFYHDHAFGITRLNVFAGEAGGLLLQDQTEKDLVTAGTIPADQIPLIIQDKTLLPDSATVAANDPTWPFADRLHQIRPLVAARLHDQPESQRPELRQPARPLGLRPLDLSRRGPCKKQPITLARRHQGARRAGALRARSLGPEASRPRRSVVAAVPSCRRPASQPWRSHPWSCSPTPASAGDVDLAAARLYVDGRRRPHDVT